MLINVNLNTGVFIRIHSLVQLPLCLHVSPWIHFSCVLTYCSVQPSSASFGSICSYFENKSFRSSSNCDNPVFGLYFIKYKKMHVWDQPGLSFLWIKKKSDWQATQPTVLEILVPIKIRACHELIHKKMQFSFKVGF